MTHLKQNSKIKKTSEKFGVRIFNFNIPAYKSTSGKITCPFAKDCVAYCYAQKGNYKRFAKTVGPSLERNYELTKTDHFITTINSEITKRKADYIRIHDSGDFYSPQYLAKWIQIAKDNPDVRFYAYTKSYSLFTDELPDNFDVIFSEGAKDPLPLERRHARIFTDKVPSDYTDASKYDLLATKWFSGPKIGLMFH